MSYNRAIPVHETAFMISSFRATDPKLSRDPYAYLWNNPETDKWVKLYLEEISIDEKWSHCLRNRFYLETMEKLVQERNVEVIINFGAGFSMYPFLMENDLLHIEIDKPEVIDYKTQKLDEWEKKGLLPSRKIHSIQVDFSTEYENNLRNELMQLTAGKRCFVLVEGVLFFLTFPIIENLFSFFNSFLQPGDFIGSASFQSPLKETTAFKNLIRFFDKHFTTEENPYQTLDDAYYWNKKNYKLIDRQDYFSLSATHHHKPELEKDEILNENFYILEKVR